MEQKPEGREMPNRIVQILGIFPQSLPFQGPQCSLFHLPTQMLPILLSSKKTSVVPSALNDYFFFLLHVEAAFYNL